MFLAVAIALLLCYVIYFFLSLLVESFRRLPPGPFPLPIIGNAHLLSDKPHMDFARLGKTYGPIYKLQLGSQLAVVISDLGLVREAARMGADFSGRPKTTSGEIFSGNGRSIGFQNYSDQWRRQHKAFIAAIHACEGKNGSLETVTLQEVEKLHQRLRKQCGSIFDPRLDFGMAVANIFAQLMFGVTYEKDDSDLHSLLQQTLHFSKGLAAANVLDAFPLLRIFPFQLVEIMKETVAKRDSIFQAKHDDHRVTFKEGRVRDIADALLKFELDEQALDSVNPCLDEKRRMFTINESMIAGIESPLAGFLWILVLLAENPDVQKKLQDSIDDVTNGNNVTLTSKDRSKFDYVEAVIMESLRLANPIPVGIPHCTTTDTSLAGYSIPKGTTTIFNLWAIHHDPKVYPDPMAFNPDRLIIDGKFSGSGLIPFSVGHRSCPWEASSRRIMFILIGNIFREFTFEKVPGCPLPEPTKCTLGITLSSPAFKLRVKKRR